MAVRTAKYDETPVISIVSIFMGLAWSSRKAPLPMQRTKMTLIGVTRQRDSPSNGLLGKPFDSIALSTQKGTSRLIGPGKAKECHPHSVEQDLTFDERLIATVRTPDRFILYRESVGAIRISNRRISATDGLQEISHLLQPLPKRFRHHVNSSKEDDAKPGRKPSQHACANQ